MAVKLRRFASIGVLVSALFGTAACSTMPTQDLVSDLSSDTALDTFYQQRSQTTLTQYFGTPLLDNIAEYYSGSNLHFADQTVYLGFFVGWQSLASINDHSGGSLSNLAVAIDHLLTKLVVVTQVGGVPNTGYFVRDNMSLPQITLNGTSYTVTSDDMSGTDDEMSQDQVIHLLFGYYMAALALPGSTDPLAAQVLAKIVAHAHDIGLRLKADNYIILTPQGQQVARGADARPLAWPIAQAISTITHQPITTYLDGIDVPLRTQNKTLHFTNDQLHDLYFTALRLVELGVCDLQYGDEHEDVCQRFTLALINSLYVSSGSYVQLPTYVDRMDADGDYIYGAAARSLLKQSRMPKAYYQAATSAQDVAFANTTAPALWCMDNRWIRMPSSCPNGSSPVYDYNALDFLAYYQVLLNLLSL